MRSPPRARPASRRWKTAPSAASRFRRKNVGLPRVKPEALRGGDAATNAKAVQDVLEGKKTPFRDVALFNAAAALVVAGKAKDLKAGFALAAQSVDSGEAEGRLDRLIVVSNDG